MNEVRVTDPVDAKEISRQLRGAGVTVRRMGGQVIVRADVPKDHLKAAIRDSGWVAPSEVKPRPWGWYAAAVALVWGVMGWTQAWGLW